MSLQLILFLSLFLSTYSTITPKFLLNPDFLSKADGINSPIYYIKMPPTPYTFIPGLGYVSKAHSASPDLVNLPLQFLGNGRPVTIYRWSQVPFVPSTPNSDVHKLDGEFVFNGKPKKNVIILKNHFDNSLYEDVLNNIYP